MHLPFKYKKGFGICFKGGGWPYFSPSKHGNHKYIVIDYHLSSANGRGGVIELCMKVLGK